MQESEQKQGACVQWNLSLLLAVTAKRLKLSAAARDGAQPSPVGVIVLLWMEPQCTSPFADNNQYLLKTHRKLISPRDCRRKTVNNFLELLFSLERKHLPCWMCRIPTDVGRWWEEAVHHCKGAKLSYSQMAHWMAVCLPAFTVCPGNVCGLKTIISKLKFLMWEHITVCGKMYSVNIYVRLTGIHFKVSSDI